MDDAYTVKVTALESGEETPEQLQALKAGDCFLVADGWGDLREGAEFWSRALGKPVASLDQDGDGRYAELETAADEPMMRLRL